MKFYGRTEEIDLLRKTRDISRQFSQFTVVTGRRRVGKTEVIKQALNDGQGGFVYLLITKQAEKTLCQDLQRDIELGCGQRIPQQYGIQEVQSKAERHEKACDLPYE